MTPRVLPPEPPLSLPPMPPERRRRVAAGLLALAGAAVLVGAVGLRDPIVVAAGLSLGGLTAWRLLVRSA